MFRFSKSGLKKLGEVNPILQKVVHGALGLGIIDITIAEGLRTKERQEEMVAQGLSETMDSLHLIGLAIDVYPYVAGIGMINKRETKEEILAWNRLMVAMKYSFNTSNVRYIHGGDWVSLRDYPHWQLFR